MPDRTNVTGTATLGGATVNAVFPPGSYVAKQYTILNATGGLGGTTFNPTVVSNMSNLKSTLSYDDNDAYLNIALDFIAAERQPQRQPAECRQRADQLLQPHRRHSRSVCGARSRQA